MATIPEIQNDDPVIADIFRRGLAKIAGVDQQEVQETGRIKEDAKKRKVDIVKEIAAELEKEYEAKELPITDIPQELVAGLQGKVSQTVIYEALGDKYKDQKQANRRKGKGKKPVSEAEPTNDEQKEQIVVEAGGQSMPSGGSPIGGSPLGSAFHNKQITMDSFLLVVDRVVQGVVDDGDYVRIEKPLFEELVSARQKV